jgi:hypothetical protein
MGYFNKQIASNNNVYFVFLAVLHLIGIYHSCDLETCLPPPPIYVFCLLYKW